MTMAGNGNRALALRDRELDRYMDELRQHPLLSRDEEQSLAQRFRDDGDLEAAHRLIVGNLRFVVKIAHEYRAYGMKMFDIIQEGNVGLMRAVKTFDPDRGYRLISYAVWWIRSHINSYVQRTWSMVRMGLNSNRRKLFYKMRSERSKAEADAAMAGEGGVSAADLAARLNVDEKDVVDMEVRLAGRDFSLNSQIGDDGGAPTHLDMLESADESQDDMVARREQHAMVRATMDEVRQQSNDKEVHIIDNRLLSDDPESLQSIGDRFGVSRERIRQLENRVVKRLRVGLEAVTA